MEYQTSSQEAGTTVTWERRIWERQLRANAEWQRRQQSRRVQVRRLSGAAGSLPAV
ncbi:hypothetical protein [uncultured Bifidobacterium sp.]|uniref:hypothetical protein n=1 Tax=uncultured Bifidobacterium sp. TaxID=165187 RepID=UPI0026070EA4|nr:hypothetical protein [uncultured Bifidobacterium sp.]